MNPARRAAMRRPLELATTARNLRSIPPEVVSTIAVEALCHVPVVSLIWQQAAFAVNVMEDAEAVALAFLCDPVALRRAATACEAGAPLHPHEVGLTVDGMLARAGARVHQT